MKLRFILFALILSSGLLSAKNYSPDSTSLNFVYSQNPFKIFKLDTSISNIYFHLPGSNFSNFNLNLGNTGSAIYPLKFMYNRENENLFRGFNQYFLTADSIRLYSSKRPYTEFNYTQGLTQEHLPSILHTQKLGSQVSISAGYKVISSVGNYKLQTTSGNSVFANIQYHSKNKSFFSTLMAASNSMNIQENGGLSTSSIYSFRFGENASNRLGMKTNLQGANNLIKHKTVSFNNYWLPFFQKDSLDSLKKSVGFYNEFNYSESSALYTDNKLDLSSGFFNKIFLDSTLTRDSIWLNKIENSFGLFLGKSQDGRCLPIVKLGYRQNWQNITIMNSSYATFDYTKISEKMLVNLAIVYGLLGRRSGDIKVNANFEYLVNLKNKISIVAFYGNQQVSYFDDFFYSNNHLWNNNFSKTQRFNLNSEFGAQSGHFKVITGVTSISNMVYLDQNSDVNQMASQQLHYYISGFKVLQNKWLRTISYVEYQYASSLIRVPNVMARQEVAFKINHKAIHIELGVLASYFSDFYASNYDPSQRDFYIQNQTRVGNVYLIDFFGSLVLGSAKIYFKVDHANAGLLGYNYEIIPRYPLNDRTIKLGVRWTFWN